jgi:hypothetical protein
MKFAKSLERLGTESVFAILAEAKKLENQAAQDLNGSYFFPDFLIF